MKHKLLNKLWLRVCMIAAVMTTALAGTAAAEEVSDVLTQNWTGVTGTSYATWSGKTATSSAVYAGQSAGGNGSIQLRSNNSNSGVVTTTSGGKLKKIKVSWQANTSSGRTLNIYGNNSAYSAATDLYSSSAQGTLLGTIVCGTSTELTVDGNYTFVGLRSSSGAMYLENITITWETDGSSDDAVATTTTIDDSSITNTDVYNGTEAGSLAATVVAGETTIDDATVTWSGNNDAVATIDATTGVVTLVAAGSVTFTASYAGVEGEYKASSATYELTVTDSTPISAGDVTFDATTDKGNTERGEGSVAKNGITFSCNDGILGNGTEYRLYKGSVTKFSVTDGTITQIVFTQSGSYAISNLTPDVGTLSDGTWIGNAASVSFTAGAQTRASKIVVTVDASATPDPAISADDVTIAYDATSGTITYTLDNEVAGGTLTAASSDSWLTVGTPAGGSVALTCEANTGTTRTATVTLTYTYGETSVTKDVTVTQEGNPNTVDNISDITAAGTYTVEGTIVAKSTRGFIVGDGTGYVYYYNSSYDPTEYDLGDEVKLSGSVVAYGGVYEFNSSATITNATQSNYVAEEPTVQTGSDMDTRVASTTPAQLSSYVQYEGTLSVSGTYYNVTSISGATTAIGSISYPISTDFTALDGKKVKVTGYYVGVSSSKYYNTLIGSIEEVVSAEPSIAVSTTTVEAAADGAYGTITVTYNNITDVMAEVIFCDADGNETTYDWIDAEINSDNNVDYLIDANTSTEARMAYLKVYALDDEANDVYSDLITITQAGLVVDYATLPFVWNGGTKEDLLAENGVTANGLGTDYAESNAPYRVKLDGTGDYIEIKTDCQPVLVSLDVKMIGGASTSTITVQQSNDGENFTDLDELEISGSQNSVLYLQTFSGFDADTRYVRLVFTKGSNVGVGGITIEKDYDTATVGEAGYATYVAKHNVSFPSGVEAYIAAVNGEYVTLTEVLAVAKGTAVVLKGAGEHALEPAAAADLDDVTANELKASDEAVVADGTQYILAKPAGEEIGFYQATAGSTIAAGKAYLEITGGAGVKGYAFSFGDDATSINEELRIKNEELEGVAIFNLAGQRLQKMQKGINIVGGRKVLK